MSYFETGQVTRTILVDTDYNPTSTGAGGTVEVSGATFDELGNLNVIDSGASTTLGLISGYTNNTSANTAGIYTTITDVCDYTFQLSEAVNTENDVAGNSLLQVGGRYDATGRTLGDGDSGALAVGVEGAVITRMRCAQQTLADNIPNTNRELPLSCTGNYVNFPTFGYVYNATGGVWDRMRGDTNGLQVTTGTGVELSVKTESGTFLQTSIDDITAIQGQKAMGGSIPVAIASNQSPLDVKTTGTNTVATTLESIAGVVGQNDKDNSLPVTLASNQDPITVVDEQSLQTRRANGKCFVASVGAALNSVSTVNLLTIDNTSGVNSLFVYNITISIRNSLTAGNSTIRLVYGDTVTGGSSATLANLQLGGLSPTATTVYNASSIANQVTFDHVAVNANSSATSPRSDYYLDFQEEMIEVPAGNSVAIEYALGGTGNITWGASMRFYEL